MPAGYRPIVADNGSRDGSAALARSLGAEVVVEGTPSAWRLRHRLANRALAFELRERSGVAVTDLGPMRAAPREELLQLGIEDRRFGWSLEMVLPAADSIWRSEDVVVPHAERTGRSKVTGTVRGYARTVRDMAAVLR